MNIFLIFLTILLLQILYVSGIGIDITRDSCFEKKQEGCDTDFVDIYKNLSRSDDGKLANTYFLLFTRNNRDEPEKLHKCGGRLPPGSNFNPNNKVVILAHSFMSSYCLLKVYSEWKDEILKKEDANVVAIDYNWMGADYKHAHPNLRLIAKQTVALLKNIKEQAGVSELNIGIVGISLGAQLAGYIGQFYKEEGSTVKRIIGLDPAGPDFNEVPVEEKLSSDDAELVDVWHCNAGELGTTYDGGHVNYYINGGEKQLSCLDSNIKSAFKEDIAFALGTLVACSHLQCMVYFKESINPVNCQFVGVKCNNYKDFKDGKCKSCGPNGENCLIMGYNMDEVIDVVPENPQKYYLHTRLVSPYCDEHYVDLDGYEPVYDSSLSKETTQGE